MSWFTELMDKGEKQPPAVKPQATSSAENTSQAPAQHASIDVDLINSEHLFYDLLFGKQADSLEIENELEQQIVEEVGKLLINPSSMEFEPFPKPLKDALAKIDHDESIEQIEQSLQQDPVMAGEIVKLANSAAFKRSDKEVDSLKMAINFVGLTSLKQIVTAASMGSVMKVSPIYFKLFGQNIWQHSMLTAQLCEQAAKEQGLDPYAAFFVGLIHDIGKIAIFKKLVAALQQAMPGVQPGSIHFREMMTSMSKQLTINIVKDWGLPDKVIQPLCEHITHKAMTSPNPLTKILVESKLLSELSLLLEAKLITELELEMILMRHQISLDKIELLKIKVV